MFNENKMKKIIESNNSLSKLDKDIYLSLFSELAKEQENLYEALNLRIEKEIINSTSNKNENWDIYTTLVDKDKLDDYLKMGFNPVINIDCASEFIDMKDEEIIKNKYMAGVAFLKCKYSDVQEYTLKTYKARIRTKSGEVIASYNLFFSNVFLEREKILEITANQYKMDKPFIFSPFSRRAVSVCINLDGINLDEIINVNLDFKNNKLDEIILVNKILLWNVEMFDKEDIFFPTENNQKKIAALFEDDYEIYKFELNPENEFLYLDSDGAYIKRIDDEVYLAINNIINLESLIYIKLKINKIPRNIKEDEEFIFENEFNKTIHKIKTRLRTEADIEYTINQFAPKGIKYLGYQATLKGTKSVYIYDKDNTYHYPKSGRLRSSSIAYLKFQESNELFFEDKISYLINFLNYKYPEFLWVGVV